MKEVPESLKLEFTLAMRELEAEIQKQKQEKETLRQAIQEGFSKKKNGRSWISRSKRLTISICSCKTEQRKKRRTAKKILTFEKKYAIY